MENNTFNITIGYDTDIQEIDSNSVTFSIKLESQLEQVIEIAKNNKMYLIIDFTEE